MYLYPQLVPHLCKLVRGIAAHGFEFIGVIHYVPFAFSVKETHTNDAKHVK